MLSSSTDVVALARQEAFKDFSFFDEETVPVVSQSIVSTVSISLFLSLSLSLSLSLLCSYYYLPISLMQLKQRVNIHILILYYLLMHTPLYSTMRHVQGVFKKVPIEITHYLLILINFIKKNILVQLSMTK